MEKLLIRWIFVTAAILAVPYVINGVEVDSFGSAFVAAAVLGILNVVLRPILVILTLPITVLTLGIFLFVINAIIFHFVAGLVAGIAVHSFWSSLGASLVVSFANWITNLSIRSGGGGPRITVRTSGFGGGSVGPGRKPIKDVTPK